MLYIAEIVLQHADGLCRGKRSTVLINGFEAFTASTWSVRIYRFC